MLTTSRALHAHCKRLDCGRMHMYSYQLFPCHAYARHSRTASTHLLRLNRVLSPMGYAFLLELTHSVSGSKLCARARSLVVIGVPGSVSTRMRVELYLSFVQTCTRWRTSCQSDKSFERVPDHNSNSTTSTVGASPKLALPCISVYNIACSINAHMQSA